MLKQKQLNLFFFSPALFLLLLLFFNVSYLCLIFPFFFSFLMMDSYFDFFCNAGQFLGFFQ